MSVLKITKDNFEELVLHSTKPILLDFYADWCGPCRMLGPTVHEIADEHPEYAVGKINVDEEPELAEAFSVNSIPAVFVLKNGKTVASAVGVRPKDALLSLFKTE